VRIYNPGNLEFEAESVKIRIEKTEKENSKPGT